MATGDFRQARGILADHVRTDDPPEVRIRRMRDNDVLGMGAVLEDEPMPDRAVVEVAAKEPDMIYTTLLTCMAVGGGPEDCCGCFNGRYRDTSIEFWCNECGRTVFRATPRKDISVETYNLPDFGPSPIEDDLKDPAFLAVWDAIKQWDIQRHHGEGYAGAMGNDVMVILNAVRSVSHA